MSKRTAPMISRLGNAASLVSVEGISAPQKTPPPAQAPVDINLSASKSVFGAVDDFFNLGKEGRLDAYDSLGPEEKEQFIQLVAKLAKSGYMGYEILEVDGHPERHDIDLQIADKRTRNAPLYNESGQRVDL